MSRTKVLITGGAGFIGSHLAEELLAHGYEVRVLDSMTRRAHRHDGRPRHLDRNVELLVGDVRDGAVVEEALEGIGAVFHLAAAVGSGESVFELDRCMSVNNVGTAVLMDRLVRSRVERLYVASSMSIYGEGLYRDAAGSPVEVRRRTPEQLRRGEWEPTLDGAPLTPAPTPETKAASVGSVYSRSKNDKERMCLRMGRAFGIPTTALRLFDVVGPRQTAQGPYASDLTAMAERLLAGRRPQLTEDGLQTRDLVGVRDVAKACRLALESSVAHEGVLNVGSGRPITAAEVARRMARILGRPHLRPEVTGEYRPGAVRHCFADVSRARRLVGWSSETDLDASLTELVEWVASQGHGSGVRAIKPPRRAPLFPVTEVAFGLGAAS